MHFDYRFVVGLLRPICMHTIIIDASLTLKHKVTLIYDSLEDHSVRIHTLYMCTYPVNNSRTRNK